MIGVILSKRREEFYDFISKHPLNVTEIFDITNENVLKSFDTIYSDDPVALTGSFSIIDISQGRFEDIFRGISQISDSLVSEGKLRCTFSRYQQKIVDAVPDLVLQDLDDVGQKQESNQERELKPILIDPVPNVTETIQVQPELEDSDTNLDNLFSRPEPRQSTSDSSLVYSSPQQALQPQSRRAVATNLFESRSQTVQVSGTALHVNTNRGQKKFHVPVFTFCGLTDKSGVSTVALSLAASLALQNPETRILYLDLDMSNPNYAQTLCGINPATDASVKTIVSLSESDFVNNISLLTETVEISQGIFSIITWGQTSFTEKRMLASQDFSFFLNTIYNSFDVILVDLGKLQSTLDYQMKLLQTTSSKHFVLADGSSQRTINTFVQEAMQIPYNFEIIVNKNLPRSGAFVLRQQLRQEPVASISLHNNVERILTNQYPLSGSALYTELCALGGRL